MKKNSTTKATETKGKIKSANVKVKASVSKKAASAKPAQKKTVTKKVTAKKKPVAKKTTAKIELADVIPAQVTPESKVPEIAKPENNNIKEDKKVIFSIGRIGLTIKGAEQFRAMNISRKTAPLYHLEIAEKREMESLTALEHDLELSNDGIKNLAKIHREKLVEIREKISIAESEISSMRNLGVTDCLEHEEVKIPSHVFVAGVYSEDFKSRAAQALGFKASKTHLVNGVFINGYSRPTIQDLEKMAVA